MSVVLAVDFRSARRSESGSEAIQIVGLTFIPRRRFDKPDTPIMATVIETTYGV